jgi:hypothetical protein
MHEKEDTERKKENEWADEEPKIQVKFSNESVESSFHSREAFGKWRATLRAYEFFPAFSLAHLAF